MRVTSLFGAAAALCLFGGAGAADAASCQLQKVADLPVTMLGLRPTIQVKINGHDAVLEVDSGAFFSMVGTDASQRFDMKGVMAPFGMQAHGVGGHASTVRAVRATDFGFAGYSLKNYDFVLGDRAGGPGVDGLLGENILGVYDVEYDLADGVIRLFKPKDCGLETNLAYWSQGKALSRILIESPPGYLSSVIANAKVAGRNIKVVFDTGSALSVLSRPAAARAGVKPTSEGVTAGGVSYGLFGAGMETSIAPFDSFAIGDEEIKNTRLRIAEIELPKADMLLGADFFLSHRILVSHSQHKLYFTYNGGPVFRLDRTPQRQVAQNGPQAAGVQPATGAGAAGDEPKTADEFARRASAAAARREFGPAIAAYSRAIELDPKVARYYYDRAMARLAYRQPVLAIGDLDEALKYDPGDVRALMIRGELYLAQRDEPKARADFDAALKVSPDAPGLPLEIAAAYGRAGQFETAVKLYGAWIDAHPKASNRAAVLESRCWTRATWGKELDAGLADCDAAAKGGLRTSDEMEARGITLLRLGRIDEALNEFDAAIRAQPKAAWALYGRGLARLKKGQKEAGEADLAAAREIAPGLPQQARRFGLAPEAAGAEATAANKGG